MVENKNWPEPIKNSTQAAIDRTENPFTIQKFVYPEPPLRQTSPATNIQYHTIEFDTVTLENGEIKTEHKSARYFVEDIGQNAALEMVYMPSGVFMMGVSDEANSDADSSAVPQHQVDISAFHMSKFEIT